MVFPPYESSDMVFLRLILLTYYVCICISIVLENWESMASYYCSVCQSVCASIGRFDLLGEQVKNVWFELNYF